MILHSIPALLTLASTCALMAAALRTASKENDAPTRTFCNPIDIPYAFCSEEPSRREAADPTVIVYKGEYWLFPSKSEGYWHSKDFANWQFVATGDLPLDEYAPTVLEMNGKMYWTAFNSGIYVTDDPASGKWTLASETQNNGDPALFLDDDGRVYSYSGCSNNGSIWGHELDLSDGFKPLSELKPLYDSNIAGHGWEIKTEPETPPPYSTELSYIEGAWMNKHEGKYYLQYAAPATEYKSYGDGVYVSDHPLGPFTYAPYSPFSSKFGGFIGGAGHSSTFQDLGGHYWHIVTMVISVRHMFERRLGLFPTWFTKDGQLVTDTYLGDYPQFLPGVTADPKLDNSPGWMLLTLKKSAMASSTLDGHPVENALDEDIRTWWSANTDDPGEWLEVDMGKRCRVNAAQINFADEGSTQIGKLHGDGYGYKLDLSEDGKTWTTVVDRSTDMRDSPHDYAELASSVFARYARLTNTHTPAGAKFSISGLRLFGSGLGKAPAKVESVQVNRDTTDSRQATITWQPVDGADGYIVRYGIAEDRLFTNYQVYSAEPLHIHSLNVGVEYYFAVDSFNDSCVTKGTGAVEAK